MILIVDCGSTKAEWAFVEDGIVIERFSTDGFNPNFCDMDLLQRFALRNVNESVDIKHVTDVFYYGTGCGNETNAKKMSRLLGDVFTDSNINVYSDALGACHSLFGNNHGVACILGTGSNACLYDGGKIIGNAVSLGYVLGDEGSGCHIGKKLVRDYFYGVMPESLRDKFVVEYHLDRNTLINNVYQKPYPSMYIASFSKFAGVNIENQYMTDLVSSSFNEFFEFFVKPLKKEGEISFVGSIAYCFIDLLDKCASNNGFTIKKIVKNPMDGLVDYYNCRKWGD